MIKSVLTVKIKQDLTEPIPHHDSSLGPAN